MKSLLSLHTHALVDTGALCDTMIARDIETLTRRWEHEGDSFLTITLPLLAKALERGLASGVWPKSTIAAKFHHNGGLPAFLRGFLLRVFSPDGLLLDDPDANCIWAVRQVCYLTHKVERATTDERLSAAFAGFIRTDVELKEHWDSHEPPVDRLKAVFLQHFGKLLDSLETKVASFALVPKHGPGAVAEKWAHPKRWDFSYWPERLNEVFPHWRYGVYTPSYSREYVPPENERPVRVVAVPKTMSTPRIIAIEPSIMQFAQQGLKREIYEEVRACALNNLIGFTDQTRNQRLACEASLHGNLATLDLSEASDRVHNDLVLHLFDRWPHLRDFIQASRSARADVNGEVIDLTKFASMGSALTFPIEAMCFAAIALLGMQDSGCKTGPDQYGRTVSVYGDDIIVPTDAVSSVISLLELFGFKVNENKSFWTGEFRESCGSEYFRGHDVSVVRFRSDLARSRKDADRIVRQTEFRNRSYLAGLWSVVRYIDGITKPVVKLHPRNFYDSVAFPSADVSRTTFLATKWRARWDTAYHNWVEHHYVSRPMSDAYQVDGPQGLLKWMLEAEARERPVIGTSHPNEERPYAFHINMRGVPTLR